jgi:hypothetical protein
MTAPQDPKHSSRLTCIYPATSMMHPTQTTTFNGSSSPSTPTRTEVDAALQYILRKTSSKSDAILSSPMSVIRQVSEDKSDYEVYPASSAKEYIKWSKHIQSNEEPDVRWNPIFDLPESSSIRVMSDMLRSAFTSQVSSKHINRELLNAEETVVGKEDS